MPETKDDNKNLLNNPIVKTINGYLVDYFSFIVIYVVLVMMAAGYFYILNPKYKNIIKNNELYQNYKRKEISQLIGVIENYQNYKNSYDVIAEDDKKKINSFLPNKDDSEELLIYIRSMMARGGYKLVSLEVGPFVNVEKRASIAVTTSANKSVLKKVNTSKFVAPVVNQATTTSELGTIDIFLTVGGLSYPALKNFLYFIERDARFFDIENIDFSLSDGIVELKLKTYYLK